MTDHRVEHEIDGSVSPAFARDQATLDFYGREAESYAADTKGGVVRWLHDFMRMPPASGRVLELGCGSGRDAEILFAHGFEVDLTDGTPAMAAQAKKRLGRPVKVMRFDELADIGVYDGVWALPACSMCRGLRWRRSSRWYFAR